MWNHQLKTPMSKALTCSLRLRCKWKWWFVFCFFYSWILKPGYGREACLRSVDLHNRHRTAEETRSVISVSSHSWRLISPYLNDSWVHVHVLCLLLINGNLWCDVTAVRAASVSEWRAEDVEIKSELFVWLIDRLLSCSFLTHPVLILFRFFCLQLDGGETSL